MAKKVIKSLIKKSLKAAKAAKAAKKIKVAKDAKAAKAAQEIKVSKAYAAQKIKVAKATQKIKVAKAAQKIEAAKRAKLIKKAVKEAEELNPSAREKIRYRTGKQAYKSYVPEIQKALDKKYGGSTLKVIKPVKKRHGGMIGGGRQSRQDRQK